MLNFTVGPVQCDEQILEIGARQIPYFRTAEFSEIMFENEQYMCEFAKAPKNARAVFITGSGTASMEAVVMNCFHKDDRVLIVNGGSFGERFVSLCKIHHIPFTEIVLPYGESLTEEILAEYDGKGYTGFLVNIHETSTGVYYDPDLISTFCKRNGLFLAVDAVSSFLADPFEMEKWKVNVMLTGSQKALALPPGISVVIMDEIALERINNNLCSCMYLDLKSALRDGERGQTPFTPAVGILIQMHERLRQIHTIGVEREQQRIQELAEDFRKKVQKLPVKFFSKSMSNAVTSLQTSEEKDAYEVFSILKDEYNIWICPNGGELAHKIFRVGHLGTLTKKDNDILIKAMEELSGKGIL